ncbi:MAG: hypothetical protein HY873_12960 [Chloroflexi bacterium]|nr:hypothetical protein [Chloroflexota bacterium]
MTKGTFMKGTLGKAAARLAVVGLIAAVVLVGSQSTARPRTADASPIHAISLNSGICLGLGIAFGGLASLTAAEDCVLNNLAPEQMQEYVMCLRGHFDPASGKHECQTPSIPPSPPDPGVPANGDLIVDTPIHIVPDDFAGLDPFDGNQFHPGQPSLIIAFVDDDFPVRFATDVGTFTNYAGIELDKDVECNALGLGDFVDADCDQDPATKGDGVVAMPLSISQGQLDAAMDDTGKATVHVDVVQESISFPIELTAVGVPKEITLTPLFGKGRIQTGATLPTPGGVSFFNEEPDATDCNFAATTAGVLGAVNAAEKTVIVAKAQDDFGNDVVGAFINWDFTQYYPDNLQADVPKGNIAYSDNIAHQGGAALPQTPTLDTGALGISFPQFVCGGRQPGVLDFYTSFFLFADKQASTTADETIQIEVVGPATDVALTAEPPVIDCNGTNTSTVTATFTNAAGDPVANGLDANFEVLALGTANPLKGDTTDGKASTTITPLSGAGGLTADGQPKGVTVRVFANGQIHVNDPLPFDVDGDGEVKPDEGIDHDGVHQTFDTVEKSILVQCTGGPPAPGTGAAGAGAGGPGTGTIRPPDTGSGPAGTAGGFAWWSLVAAGVAGVGLAAAGRLTRHRM